MPGVLLMLALSRPKGWIEDTLRRIVVDVGVVVTSVHVSVVADREACEVVSQPFLVKG
jgi:hypothetical protein